MKRQRPSLDTSFGSLSLGRPALSVSASDAQRVRADSAASHSSSSVAFTTPPDGRSPYYHPRLASSLLSTSSLNPTEAPRNDAVLNLTHSPQDTDDLPVETPEIYEYVKAKYDYTPTDPSGLSFTAGQFIQVHYKDESGWWNGEVANVRVFFSLISPVAVAPPTPVWVVIRWYCPNANAVGAASLRTAFSHHDHPGTFAAGLDASLFNERPRPSLLVPAYHLLTSRFTTLNPSEK
ncbi:hypothetical protein FRC18_000792 [Serendipita sp. 400]|nr:hypothetical protein FRC18_000792 [Serendipita sp. 400]